MTLDDVKALIEGDTNIPSNAQHFFVNGKILNDSKQTLERLEVREGDMLGLAVRDPQKRGPAPETQSRNTGKARRGPDTESLRLQLIGDPRIRAEIRQTAPELADAADNKERFHELFNEHQRKLAQAQAEKEARLAALNADPFNVEAQKEIEEMIRMERVQDNIQEALEHNPEMFGRVTMLYIPVTVNGVPVKAFVDSGAQATIMSPSCAERTNIMRLIDRRYAGIAKGVGTAAILGRVHSAEIQIGKFSLPSSFTVMEGKDVDLLLGLDMLKRHQMDISLRENCLKIHDDKIPFLPESEIPKSAEEAMADEPKIEGPGGMKVGARSGAVEVSSKAATPGPSSLASRPSGSGSSQQQVHPGISVEAVSKITELGFTKEEAIQALSQPPGNNDNDQAGKMKTTWKEIQPVPTSQEFIDIVLSRTQRRLPTQIRSGFKISRIRGFYTRKVKFTAETFAEKFQSILDGFPRLQDIHPFHKDLLNTLYDADHFRIALGQVSTAKRLIETVSRDYVRLLKYAQSLFQCKQLKRAALGRMATICKRLKDPLVYLEQVRQHLGRLPSIDPNTRTLLICGYPNVGKSSFLKSITRADVDVQPYAFTTKSLFVGHFDYKYLRFQAIDTPGILDHPLEEMNTIEMQSITAIAHLRSAILYFMDLSEQCGYTVQAQIQLFRSIRPLFANKLVFIVINKIDVMRPEDLHPDTQQELEALTNENNVEVLQLSCITTEGVSNVKNAACDRLIEERVAQKLKTGTNNTSGAPTGRLGDLLARIHVAQPLGGVVRETFIPEGVTGLKKYDKNDPERRKLARDIEEENGGAGVFNVDLKEDYDLADPEWKHDKVPEVFNGKNVYDFIDPEIESKLAELEEEEEKLEAEGFYDSDESLEDEEEADIRMKADLIREKQALMRNDQKLRKTLHNRALIPRKSQTKTLSQLSAHLDSIGHDPSTASSRLRAQARGRSSARSEADPAESMDVDPSPRERLLERSRSRAPVSNRQATGVADPLKRSKAERLAKLGQVKMNRMARQGEADRHIAAAMPKHLVAGKRGMGKTSRR